MSQPDKDLAAEAVAQARHLVAGLHASASAGTVLGFTPAQIVSVVGVLAGAVAGPAPVLAGMTVAQLTGLVAGIAGEVPDAIAAFEMIKGHADAGTAPTPEEMAVINAAADEAHARAQAAADRVLNGSGP